MFQGRHFSFGSYELDGIVESYRNCMPERYNELFNLHQGTRVSKLIFGGLY